MTEITSAPLALAPRLVRACWAIVIVLTIASTVGAALSPVLLVKFPWLLVLLAPDGRHVALIVGRVDPVLLGVVTVLRRTVFSVGAFGLGLAYGEVAVSWIEARARSMGKALRMLERLFARVGAALLLALPLLTMSILAGAARTRFVVFLPALVVGHCLWVGTTIWLGNRFAETSKIVVDFFAARLVETTLACIALVVLQQLFARRKKQQ